MSDGVCANCGGTLQPGDRYCGVCGSPATAVASVFSGEPTAPVSVTPGSAPGSAPNPIAVAQMPTVPPPVGALDGALSPRRRGRVVAGVIVVIIVAAGAATSLAFLSTRDDLQNSRARVAQLEASTTTPTSQSDPSVGGALVPVVPNIDDELAGLQAQIDQLKAALATSNSDLAALQESTAAEESKAAEAATAAAAVQSQLTALQGLFPIGSASFAAADPTGSYATTLTAGECTLADCTVAVTTLSINFTDPTTVAGNRASGTATLAGGTYTVSGTVGAAVAPLCAGVAAPTGYALVMNVSGVTVIDGALRAASMRGTYTETISAGDCSGQHRAYTVDLTRQ